MVEKTEKLFEISYVFTLLVISPLCFNMSLCVCTYLPLSLLVIKYKTDILFLSSGFPFFVSVTSTSTGRFFPTNVGLCSHDFVKNVAGKSPKYLMGDGAKEITNAGKEVFKDLGVRLMCWPHTYRNVNIYFQ